MEWEEPVCFHCVWEKQQEAIYSASFLNYQYGELVSIKYVLLKSGKGNLA